MAYIKYSEETNALDYLEKAHFFITVFRKGKDQIDWKWVILTVHAALYGFAICAIKGTSSKAVLKGKDLIGFGEALKRVQDPAFMTMTINSKHLVLDAKQKASIKTLHETFRNNFTHYKPMSWYIEVRGMSRIVNDSLYAIRFLSLDTGNYVHLSEHQRRRIKSLIRQSKKVLMM